MILTILKIIGLFLLVILCVLLVLILMALLIPVRYSVEFEYDDKALRLDVKVTWLLSVVRCYAGLLNKEFFYKVKALFFTIINSTKAPKEEKTTVKGKQSKEAEESSENAETKPDDTVRESAKQEPAQEEEGASKQEPPREEDPLQNSVEPSEEPSFDSEKTQKKTGKKLRIPFRLMHPADIYDKIVRTLMNFSRKIDKICAQIVSEENRETVLFVLVQLKELLYHIRPRKHGIYLKLGMKDPALTGQIMGAYSVLNSVFGMNFILEPVFDYEVLETRLYAKGHIRVISLIIIAVRLYRNKVIRKLIRRK